MSRPTVERKRVDSTQPRSIAQVIDRRGVIARVAPVRPSVLLLLLLFAAQAPGQSAGDFEIPRSTIDNGGGTSTSGDFSLTGAVGQTDASETAPSGGDFEIRTGFFGAATSSSESDRNFIFSNGFEE